MIDKDKYFLPDNFLSADFGLPTNLFEDEFLLENILTEDVIADDLAVRGIKEELESWAGVSSASSSPTFIHRNGSSGSSDSEEEKYRTTTVNPYEFLRDVVVNGERNNRSEVSMNEPRDTPSPGSTSSSSGCFSDFSCKTNDTNVNVLSHGRAFDQIPPATLTLPNPPQNTCPLQFIQSPPVAPTADPIPIQQQSQKLKKTVILSPQDFDQLMKNMRGSRAMPRIQTFAQPVPVTIKQNPLVAARPAAEPMACPSNQVVDERRYKKQQRLIRNRESANLSRKKKKEFVDTLQETIQRLGTEKEQLVNVSDMGPWFEGILWELMNLLYFPGEHSTESPVSEQRLQQVQSECAGGEPEGQWPAEGNQGICDEEELYAFIGHDPDRFVEFRSPQVSFKLTSFPSNPL